MPRAAPARAGTDVLDGRDEGDLPAGDAEQAQGREAPVADLGRQPADGEQEGEDGHDDDDEEADQGSAARVDRDLVGDRVERVGQAPGRHQQGHRERAPGDDGDDAESPARPDQPDAERDERAHEPSRAVECVRTAPSRSCTSRPAHDATVASWVTMQDGGTGVPRGADEGFEHLLAREGVEGAGRLVGEHDRGPVHQRAGDGDALRLSSGHLVQAPVREVGDVEPLEHLERRRPCRSWLRPEEAHGQLDVLGDGQLGHQVAELEHEPELLEPHPRALPLGQAVDAPAEQLDLARVGRRAAHPGGAAGSTCPTRRGP